MANFITIFRIFLVFIAVYLIMNGGTNEYIWAFFLTVIAFSLDGLDGYVARKFNESSKLGAMLDIMSDRIVENTFWVTFAVMGWLPIAFPLIALTRGFVTDGIRSVAMEKGFTAFGDLSMQESKVGYFICSSKFSRISYAVAKVVAFTFLILAYMPLMHHLKAQYEIAIIANISAFIAIEFCVIRALPVVFESKKFFKEGPSGESVEKV